jgi:hypothetical protein
MSTYDEYSPVPMRVSWGSVPIPGYMYSHNTVFWYARDKGMRKVVNEMTAVDVIHVHVCTCTTPGTPGTSSCHGR